MSDALFRRIELLADRAPSLADLEYHRLAPIAARRWRRLGRPVPAELVTQERLAAAAALAVPVLLERVRAASDGPLLVIKGPEVARLYPDPALRSMGDVDIVVLNADRTQRRLMAAGFREVGEPELFRDIHHLRPLLLPGLPLLTEIHHSLKWIEQLEPPGTAKLLAAAVPAPYGVDGVLALPPAHHAILLAAHAWAHRPLGRLGDLLDVALTAREADPAELDQVADDWGVSRVWRTTRLAACAVLGHGSKPLSLALWARHLDRARERTVLESHLQACLSPLWGLPALRATREALGTITADLLPKGGERWPSKLNRTRVAARNAFIGKSRHDRTIVHDSTGGR
jgi:Uncharacterised nucleotidyltransferase